MRGLESLELNFVIPNVVHHHMRGLESNMLKPYKTPPVHHHMRGLEIYSHHWYLHS